MRNLLYLLILSAAAFKAEAQQYQYVPTTAYPAMWQVISVYTEDDSAKFSRKCTQVNWQFTMHGADTLVNGKYYKMITSREYSDYYFTLLNQECPLPDVKPKVANHPESVYTFIREDNKALYDWHLGYPYFDFNAGIGTNSPNSGYMQNVAAIDTIAMGGVLRRRFITQYDTIIEGIGTLRGGLAPIALGKSRLTCFESNGQIIYQDPYTPCGALFPKGTPTDVADASAVPEAIIYPNPFTDNIRINHAPDGAIAGIYNSIGQLVTRQSASNMIETTSLPSGMYFIILKSADGNTIYTQKLLKQ
ncbi:MAG: Secretion system C-terminal sorting domain [Flavipsychrobacter sp.]|jgi:hypothetical protein|nr:Secretion system C-terminal sorting domain [Flavipsychrobacter sp.]